MTLINKKIRKAKERAGKLMKFKRQICAAIAFTAMLFVSLAVTPLVVQADSAYNPITAEKEGLSNLEKARIILTHFQKSGVDSSWTYDIEKNKDVVQAMLDACVKMTDEEVSQLSYDEKVSFYEYFQKLYEVSNLDATELGELFEIKDLEKAVDEISYVPDKKADDVPINSEGNEIISPENKKSVLVVSVLIIGSGVLALALSKTIKRVNEKQDTGDKKK